MSPVQVDIQLQMHLHDLQHRHWHMLRFCHNARRMEREEGCCPIWAQKAFRELSDLEQGIDRVQQKIQQIINIRLN